MFENDKFQNTPSNELIRMRKEYDLLKSELSRVKKELETSYKLSSMLTGSISLSKFLKEVIHSISDDDIYSEACFVRIIFNEKEYRSSVFKETNWKLAEDIVVDGEIKGVIEVFYDDNKAPFEEDKKRLVKAIAEKIRGAINKRILEKGGLISDECFSMVFMKNPTAMLMTDFENENEVVEVNETFITKTGYNREEIIEKKATDLKLFKDVLINEELISELEQLGFVDNKEVKLTPYNGNEFHATLSAKTVVVKDKKHILFSFVDISETELAKQQLEEKNRQMLNILRAFDDAYLQVNNYGIILAVNNAAVKMFGYDSKEEMIGMSSANIISSEDRTKVVKKLFKDKTLKDYTLQAKRKDNSQLWISFNMRPTYDSNGNIDGRQEFARDITPRILLEKDLILSKEIAEKNERLLNEAQDIGRTGSWDWIIETETVTWSQNFYHLLGLDTDTKPLSFAEMSKFFSPENYEKLKQAVDESLATGEPYQIELEVIKSDNSRTLLQIRGRVIKDELGNVIGVRGIVADINEQKKLERDLIQAKEKAEENESKFRNAFENSGIGMCLVSLEGTFMEVNKAMTRILGYSENEFLNLTFQQITHPDDLVLDLDLLNETVEGKRSSYYLKKRYFHKSKKLIYANLNVSLIRNDEGAPLFFVSQIEDVTKQEEYVHELELAKEKAEESDRLKSAFLLNVSHEIRTPMNGILGFLELLNQPDLANEERSEFINLINKSGERLTNTINDIVEISKIEVGDLNLTFEEVDILELMNYHYRFFKHQAEEKQLEFKIDKQIEGESALVKTDKHKLDGILMNLIRNAIKFTDEGKVEIGNYIVDDKLWFYVNDTGRGIPKDRLGAIFNRFVQADQGITRGYEGSGIGLSIVKAYINVLGGEIEVQSNPGKGSTFLFYIPYTPVSIMDDLMSEKNMKENIPTILIAEDDDLNCQLLKQMLTKDYQLLFARTGKEAVDLFQEYPEISLVLMDIKMPGDFNGLEAIRRIKAINDKIPVVAQTAFAMDINKREAFEAGCDDYISKPYGIESLKSVIRSLL